MNIKAVLLRILNSFYRKSGLLDSLMKLKNSSTETTRIYAVPSVDMMRKVMESGNLESDEKPLWPDDEAEMARICGLR